MHITFCNEYRMYCNTKSIPFLSMYSGAYWKMNKPGFMYSTTHLGTSFSGIYNAVVALMSYHYMN